MCIYPIAIAVMGYIWIAIGLHVMFPGFCCSHGPHEPVGFRCLEQVVANLKLNYSIACTGPYHSDVVMDQYIKPILIYTP